MNEFNIRRLAEGENRGKLGIFEGDRLVGIGSFEPSVSARDREQIALLAEGGSRSRQLLVELIQKRMLEFNESYNLAEINVVRTDEGLALWEKARLEKLV